MPDDAQKLRAEMDALQREQRVLIERLCAARTQGEKKSIKRTIQQHDEEVVKIQNRLRRFLSSA